MNVEIDRTLMRRLRKLIGRDCMYLGKQCLVIDVLPEDGVLILETREELPPIQIDQYGQPANRSNDLQPVPIFGADKTSFSDEIMDLFASVSDGKQSPAPDQV